MRHSKLSRAIQSQQPQAIVDLLLLEIPTNRVKTMGNFYIDYFYNNIEEYLKGYTDTVEGSLCYVPYKQLLLLVEYLGLAVSHKTKISRQAAEDTLSEYFSRIAYEKCLAWHQNHTRLLQAIKQNNPFGEFLNKVAVWEEHTGLSYFD